MLITATYSPEDNKIRLSASSRLSPELYARVKAAGFTWAPKQGIFIAPMWTPEREDLARELAGEIDDEDSTLMDRAEERAERFDEYSEKRLEEANAARAAVDAITSGIPLGQPILVGHHSEKRARKDAERIENGIRRAVNLWATSEYWTGRAKAAIRHAKYKERPDVRARRIKGLEADRRKQCKIRDEQAMWLRLWDTVHDADASPIKRKAGSDLPPLTTLERARWIGDRCHLYAVRHDEPGGPWTAFDVLRPDGERYERCPAMTPEQVQEIARRSYPLVIERCERWIAHLDNRLAYERAMLDDQGGTVSDRKGPEVGGGVRCWASPQGGWSYVQKVNKVSVSVLDNWGNGGRNFVRTIPFDKLAATMTKAEVDAKRAAGLLVELAEGIGFALRELPPETRKPAEPKPDAAAFEQLADVLANGGVKAVSAPQLFPTPAPIAARMVELAELAPGMRVLEPSAGTGALLSAIGPDFETVAVEINAQLAERLIPWGETRTERLDIRRDDFLALGPDQLGTFDRIVMNPPFADGQDIAHILHARKFLRPGGRIVALCANGPRQRAKLAPFCAEWEDLPPGSFAEQGTGVNVALLIVDYEE